MRERPKRRQKKRYERSESFQATVDAVISSWRRYPQTSPSELLCDLNVRTQTIHPAVKLNTCTDRRHNTFIAPPNGSRGIISSSLNNKFRGEYNNPENYANSQRISYMQVGGRLSCRNVNKLQECKSASEKREKKGATNR